MTQDSPPIDPVTAKRRLADAAAQLTRLDSLETPQAARPRWRHLCTRKSLLHDLVQAATALADAHRAAGSAASADAMHELTEHYQHLYALAARAVLIARPPLASGFRPSVPRQPTQEDNPR